MMGQRFALIVLMAATSACITPSVVAREDRGVALDSEEVEWSRGAATDLPGIYVSTELTGPLAGSIRKLVYLFEAGGTYTGAGLIEDTPPHFEVISGHWLMEAEGLRLDDGPPGILEVAQDGSLRLTGEEGRVVLRRELSR